MAYFMSSLQKARQGKRFSPGFPGVGETRNGIGYEAGAGYFILFFLNELAIFLKNYAEIKDDKGNRGG